VAPPSHNLPAHLPTLIGREEAVTTVRERLLQVDCGLLTLTGTGGSGKTRLALAVAATLLDEFPDGVLFVELASITDPALVAGATVWSQFWSRDPADPFTTNLSDALRFLIAP